MSYDINMCYTCLSAWTGTALSYSTNQSTVYNMPHTRHVRASSHSLFDMQAGIKPPTFCLDDLLHVECTPHGLTVSLLALLAPAAGQTAGDGGVNASVRCTEDLTADHFSQNETQIQDKRTPWKVTDSVMNSV